MERRTMVWAGLLSLLGFRRSLAIAAPAPRRADFPPVPKWRPSFQQPLDRVIDRMRYYTDRKRDFAVFQNGTCALLAPGLSDDAARRAAMDILSKIFNAHPDMNPARMDDGNILVRYNEPAFNVVLEDIARAHWTEVDARHQDGLAGDEVLITPLGQNVFDDLGKKALLGRAYMFMDAQDPEVVRIERNTA